MATARGRSIPLIPGTWTKQRFAFGGALLKNSHAKSKRPFVAKLPLHVVIRSSAARGKQSLFAHQTAVKRILDEQSVRNRVQISCAANAGNHLHLLVEAPSRAQLAGFLRGITGRIATAVTGSRKGNALAEKGFWDARPFTRIVSRGADRNGVARYIAMNSTELAGFSRLGAREMFRRIAEVCARGGLPRGPGLVAAGFG